MSSRDVDVATEVVRSVFTGAADVGLQVSILNWQPLRPGPPAVVMPVVRVHLEPSATPQQANALLAVLGAGSAQVEHYRTDEPDAFDTRSAGCVVAGVWVKFCVFCEPESQALPTVDAPAVTG